jgi:ATP-binding cassette subfamily B protein
MARARGAADSARLRRYHPGSRWRGIVAARPGRDLGATVRAYPPVLALATSWRAARLLTAVTIGLALSRGLLRPTLYLSTSLFAGSLAAGATQTQVLTGAAAIALLFLVIQVADPGVGSLGRALGRRVDAYLQRAVLVASLEPRTIDHVELPASREAAALARDWESSAHPPSDAIESLIELLTNIVWGVGSGVLLLPFAWWAPFAVAVGPLLQTRWNTRFNQGPRLARNANEERLRRAGYLRDLAFTPAAARESRIFGLAGWLRDRSDERWRSGMRAIWEARSATRGYALLVLVVLLGTYTGVFLLIMRGALDGQIDLAHAIVYVQAVGGVGTVWSPWALISIREGTRPLPAVEAVRRRLPGGARGTDDPTGMPRREIAFRGVGFTYPGRQSAVLAGFDLVLRAGESTAIVGANGAGKTTLVKLLCGLLEPTAGRIEVDGAPLPALDRAAWQGRVAAIFQDYVRYPFTARDNIVLGRAAAGDATLDRAVRRAIAGDVIAELPDGLATPLAREFGGVDLSGGQWQRIALARAMYAVERGAGVLILDEPTAQLDIRAEAELFDQFLELTAGLTTILISHRFSSVRHAQRIVVVDGGRIVEDGTHADLVRRDGPYAAMFGLQAAHFADA